MFVPGKPFQPSLMFRDKDCSLLRKPLITAVKSFMIQAPVRRRRCLSFLSRRFHRSDATGRCTKTFFNSKLQLGSVWAEFSTLSLAVL